MRKNKKIYGIYIALMLLLVIGAWGLPQLVFAMGDKYQLLRTQTSERANMNISQVSSDYERQMHDRMYHLFMNGGQRVRETVIDYDMQEEELETLLEEIYSQEWMLRFSAITELAYDNEFTEALPVHVQKCKKYIVYKEDVQEGIALMMWYLDLYYPDSDTRIRLLVDSETNSIYYIKVTVSEAVVKSTSSMLGLSGKMKVNEQEYLSKILHNAMRHWDYYGGYYEAETQQIADCEAQQIADSEAQQWDGDNWYVSMALEEKQGSVSLAFHYGEASVGFIFQIQFGEEEFLDISLGMTEIAEIVPEMLRD